MALLPPILFPTPTPPDGGSGRPYHGAYCHRKIPPSGGAVTTPLFFSLLLYPVMIVKGAEPFRSGSKGDAIMDFQLSGGASEKLAPLNVPNMKHAPGEMI